MNSKLLLGLVVLIAGVGIGWYVLGAQKSNDGSMEKTDQALPVPNTTGAEENGVTQNAPVGTDSADKGGVMTRVVVTYTDTGFGPKEVTVKKGTTVTFMNEGSGSMWVASAPHPTHSIYPEFDQLKSVAKGGSWEFTFDKVGTWKYHNHVKSTDYGTVIVTE